MFIFVFVKKCENNSISTFKIGNTHSEIGEEYSIFAKINLWCSGLGRNLRAENSNITIQINKYRVYTKTYNFVHSAYQIFPHHAKDSSIKLIFHHISSEDKHSHR